MANIKVQSKEEFVEEQKQNFIQNVGKGEIPENPLADVLTADELLLGILPQGFAREYKKLKKMQDELTKKENEVKEQLIKFFTEHPELEKKSASMDGLKFTYVKPSVRNTVDTKKLQEEYPDIYKKLLKSSEVKASIKTYIEY